MLKDAYRRLVLRLRESSVYSLFGNDKPEVVRQNLDVFLVATALKCYDWQLARRDDLGARVDAELTKGFVKELEELHADGRKRYVHDSINRQMVAWFNRFEKESSSSSRRNVEAIERDSSTNGDDERESTIMESLYEEHAKKKIEEATSNSLLDFSLSVKTSTIKGAGKGLFINNIGSRDFISPGTLVAIFPGVVHLQEFAKSTEYVASLFPDPHFQLTMRPDGHIIDSRESMGFHIPQNPLAVAQYVNHVPVGKEPNVMQIPYDFLADPWGTLERDGFPSNLRKLIPLKYAQAPTLLGTLDQSVHMHAMVLITIKPVRDDTELFMDYRLPGDSSGIPAWYAPYKRAMYEEVDEKEATVL